MEILISHPIQISLIISLSCIILINKLSSNSNIREKNMLLINSIIFMP
jgi:hypothetical protein